MRAAVSSYWRASYWPVVVVWCRFCWTFETDERNGDGSMESWWSSAGRIVGCWDPVGKWARVPSRV